MALRRVVSALLVAASFTVWLSLPACSNQGEGERCSKDNGDDDCSSPLVCTAASELGSNADLCCPPPGTAPNVEACRKNASTGTGGTAGSGGSASGGSGGDAGSAGASGGGGAAGEAGAGGMSGGAAGTAGSGGGL